MKNGHKFIRKLFMHDNKKRRNDVWYIIIKYYLVLFIIL